MITQVRKEQAELLARIIKLEQNSMVLEKELKFKKHRKFQTKCIQITKEILTDIRMLKNSKILLIVIGEKMHMQDNGTFLFDEKPEIVILKEYKKLRNSLIGHPKVLIDNQNNKVVRDNSEELLKEIIKAYPKEY
ncbi:hypothetical protein Glove_34g40 [Diversispora epigaea]|uniref:Uncharacterized protein n=1 Tax=Diversispora epigaea TaxID=1348612 RepID=A0A397JJH4_9GLOM|nr:hypothetical protein Glove_34g40 [Diversispora epigaea]